jgi:DNA topoisomerase-1
MTAAAAETGGGRLKRMPAATLSIRRIRHGKGFAYRDADGGPVRDPDTLARIRSLAIPPAYAEVRIAADPRAHLQAVGHDEAGRIQHRYHPDWDKVRERRKLGRLGKLVEALPKIRAAIARDLKLRTLCKEKALACAAAVIDRCHIRVGSESYAKANGSYGASTLLKRHVAATGGRVELSFRGKSGKDIACACDFPPLARALTRIKTLPGRRLFQYRREDGKVAVLRAGEINAYLAQAAGIKVSSKDLRMLAANAAAAELLLASDIATSEAGRKRQLADIMRAISERLVNTPAVVRKSYVHEVVVSSYASGRLKRSYDKARARGGCTRIERALGLLAQ